MPIEKILELINCLDRTKTTIIYLALDLYLPYKKEIDIELQHRGYVLEKMHDCKAVFRRINNA